MKTHVKRVLAKLELRNRTQAAAHAYKTGLVVPPAGAEPTPIGRHPKPSTHPAGVDLPLGPTGTEPVSSYDRTGPDVRGLGIREFG